MNLTGIKPDNSVLVMLSLEGPDVYSQAGGLGVRVTNLASTLADQGFPVHLFFVGDPKLKGEEYQAGGKLVLHRWCQWISAYYPDGVYQGEYEKLRDYSESIPQYIFKTIFEPAFKDNKIVIVLAEEWQTAEVVIRINNMLNEQKARNRVILFWNANNTFGFERINFLDLSNACTITTVSRYMKHIMWGLGLNPIVIPNGIPESLLQPVDQKLSSRLRKGINADLILAKIARWDPDKRWNMAIEALAGLKARGLRAVLIARGGMEGYGQEVLQNAYNLGLKVKDVPAKGKGLTGYLEAVTAASKTGADILNLKFHCPQDFLRLIYHSSNAVLANSGKEPFGLVGLETMAASGIAFTGSTGEEYAIPFYNAIVLETANPREIESYILDLLNNPEEEKRIREAAKQTAIQYIWPHIVENLVQRLEYQAKIQDLITLPLKNHSVCSVVSEIFPEMDVKSRIEV